MHSTQIVLEGRQLEALSLACELSPNYRIVGVSGQAGTGKTRILQNVYHTLTEAGYTVALAAPTGKAAKRIKEATGIQAYTVHRLLEFSHPGAPDPDTGIPQAISMPRRNREKPLNEDVVIVDEAAMLSEGLYRSLIDAIKPRGCIRLFGDVNQLPPIDETGHEGDSPFTNLLKSRPDRVIVLDRVYRQAEGSNILTNAGRILRGLPPLKYPDFNLHVTNVPINRVCSLCEQLVTNNDPMFNMVNNQIIMPTRNGVVGSVVVNKRLSQIYATGEDGIPVPRHRWDHKVAGEEIIICPGEKVIITSNKYDLRQVEDAKYDDHGRYVSPGDHEMVFNGETGVVKSVEGGYITIDLGDRTISLPPWQEIQRDDGTFVTVDPRKDLEHAYAISTHKAQGSEYDTVMYMISRSAMGMQCIPNTYTAITRARSRVVLVGDPKSISFFSLQKKPFRPWEKKK